MPNEGIKNARHLKFQRSCTAIKVSNKGYHFDLLTFIKTPDYSAPWGSGFPRLGDMGTQLDTVGVPLWNIHVFRFIPGGGRVAGFYGVWLVQIPRPLA